MIPSPFPQTLSRRDTGKSSLGHDSTPHPALASGGGTLAPQSAGAIYQHIHDMASKRISTLDYLRKALVRAESFLSRMFGLVFSCSDN